MKAFASSKTTEEARIWHERLGHASLSRMKALARMGVIQGLDEETLMDVEAYQCSTCLLSNMKESKSPKNQARRASRVGEILHVDGKGPLKPMSRNGHRYFLQIVDNYSKKRWSVSCKKRSEYAEALKGVVLQVEARMGKQVLEVRSDNEFRSYTLHRFFRDRGTVQNFTVPHSPSQNGMAERSIGTSMEMVRPCLMASGLPLNFWSDAVLYSNYVLDCLPTTSVEVEKTPYEIYYGKKPHTQFLKPFGAACFGFLPVANRINKSLGARAVKCKYLGPSEDQKGFRLWIPQTNKVMVSKTCVFANDEGYITEYLDIADFGVTEKIQKTVHFTGVQDDEIIESSMNTIAVTEDDGEEVYGIPITSDSESPPPSPPRSLAFANAGPSNQPLPFNLEEGRVLRSSSRQTRRLEARMARKIETGRVRAAMNAFAAMTAPLTLKEAQRRPDWSLWKAAIKDEMEGLNEMKCYQDCIVPKGAKVVDSRWVFEIKTKSDGSLERYRARLVAKGFSQIGGLHYFETSSPVAQMNSVKIFMPANNLEVHQLDVKQAFLIPELKEELYMKIHGQGGPQIVRLLKCLYGLKQSSYEWNCEAVKKLKLLGFIPLLSDPCIFVRRTGSEICYLALYVDDILIACKNMKLMTDLKEKICKTWTCRDMGAAQKFLGINILRKREEGLIHLSQPELLRECLHGLDLTDCKPVLTPAIANEKLVKYGEPIDQSRLELYHSIVGKLLYVANHTRPDLSVAVGQLASFVSCPTESHWQALKRVVRYCKGTLDYGTVLGGSFAVPILVGYADADWGSCEDTRRSRTGYTFHLGVGCVSHQSKKQATVALSTAEAEYMALSSATQELKWLRQLLGELGFKQNLTEIFQDNQACFQMAKGNVNHQRSKHIDMRYHFIQEAVAAGEMKLTWVPTTDMVADIMTKVLPAPVFVRLRDLLNVKSASEFGNASKEAVGITLIPNTGG